MTTETITMLGTRIGVTATGLHRYHKGETYVIGQDIGHTEACRFVQNGWATAQGKTMDEVVAEIIAESRKRRAS